MWSKRSQTFSLFLLGGFIFTHCSTTAPSPAPTRTEIEPGGKVPIGTISFPPGWDDTVIDQIKAGQPIKKVLAVLDFEGGEKLAGKVDLRMSDMLTTSLVKTGRFEVVERNKIDRVLSEQGLAAAGLVDEARAAEMGKLLGAEFVVLGAITSAARKDVDKFGYMLVLIEVGIDVRAVNTTDGRILLSESAVGVTENKVVKTAEGVIVSGAIDYNAAYAEAARNAVTEVGSKIAKLSPLIGFVVSTSQERVVIDVGEEQGVKMHDSFVVFRVGDAILHPATGQRIGWRKEVLQEIKVVSTEKTMSTGMAVRKQSLEEPLPGDLVISR